MSRPGVATAVLLLVLGVSGCETGPSDGAQRTSGGPRQVIGTASWQAEAPGHGEAERRSLSERVEAFRRLLKRFVPGDDPVEHLYFAWMLEPYSRATLAVAIKTIRVLELEVKLRQRGADALTDAQIETMLGWLDRAFAGDWTAVAHRFRSRPGAVDVRNWLESPAPADPGVLFAFADRATSTQADRWFGDFDLLACCGFRVYPVGRDRPLGAGDIVAVRAHAEALRIGLVEAPLAFSRTALAAKYDLRVRVQPVTLRVLLGERIIGDTVPAVIDPPRGESWAGMLARRALLRGATGGRGVAVGCVPPHGDPQQMCARMRAAMWVQALMGQRLGIVEGWRDVRDGTATQYRAQFTNPAYLETVAHTALDLLHHWDALSGFVVPVPLAVAVGAEHIRAGEDDSWSPQLLDLADALVARQIEFDFVPCGGWSSAAEQASLYSPYPLVVQLPNLGVAPGRQRRLSVRYGRGGTLSAESTIVPPAGASLTDALADWIGGLLADSRARRDNPILVGEAGQVACGLFVRAAADRSGLAVVNLMGVRRSVWIVSSEGRSPVPGFRDRLTQESAEGGELTLAPYQVRILSVHSISTRDKGGKAGDR